MRQPPCATVQNKNRTLRLQCPAHPNTQLRNPNLSGNKNIANNKYCHSAYHDYCEFIRTVQEIEQAIESLPREEVFVLANWLSTRFSDLWDRQIEDDISAGLLDDLAAEAVAEHRAGKSLPLPTHEK